jgi:hypothetical protein
LEQHRDGYYFKFFDTELLRGDSQSRAEYYWKMFQMGVSPNQIAEHEDTDGFEGGDIHLVPSTMQTIENAKKAAPAGGAANSPKADPAPSSEPNDPAENSGTHRMNVGRVLSSDNENKIRDARDNLDTVLSKLDQQQEE